MIISNYCLECSEPLRGRFDKKFCGDSCRNVYNNRVNGNVNNYVRNVNNVLRKNRRILDSLFKMGDKQIHLAPTPHHPTRPLFNRHTRIIARPHPQARQRIKQCTFTGIGVPDQGHPPRTNSRHRSSGICHGRLPTSGPSPSILSKS